ncbi:MAG TPA: hypothetical protein RMH99_28970 [Sandaracinaceae bacterium LLY-WYZ-13_1]|nr:hypothetical protein [Sandaracinaceae bacterium LLY-WYZ-13_1]
MRVTNTTATLCGLLLLWACDGAPESTDAGPTADAGRADAGGETPDAGTTSPDAGAPDASGFDAGAPDAGAPDAGAPDAGAPDAGGAPALEYDADGCLTWDSASARCGFESDASDCTLVASCGFNEASQCRIDCEMATTLCLEADFVDACLTALDSGECSRVSADCGGWLHF